MQTVIEVDPRIDEVTLAQLLLDSTDSSLRVYVVQCNGTPMTVRRGIHTAMGYCQATWDVFPDWVAPGYWKGESSNRVIEIYERALEP